MLFEALERKAKPADQAIIEYLDSLGGVTTATGARVGPDRAMQISTVYSCVRILADVIAMFPPRLMRKIGDGRTFEVVAANDHPVAKLLRRPNQYQTAADFWGTSAVHVLLQGNFYALKQKARGKVVQLASIKPGKMDLDTDTDDFEPRYRVVTNPGGSREISSRDLVHTRGPSVDGFRGMTPIAWARESFGLAIAQEQHAATLFSKGMRLSGILSTDAKLQDSTLNRIQKLMDKFKGTKGAHGTPVLDSNFKFTPMQMNAEDAQFLEARAFQKSDIAALFGVPLYLLNSTEKTTSWGSGLEQMDRAFVRYSVMPHTRRWAEQLGRDLLTPGELDDLEIRFDMSSFIRADFKAHQEGLAIQKSHGVINADEWREEIGRNPIGGDDGTEYRLAANLYKDPGEGSDDE